MCAFFQLQMLLCYVLVILVNSSNCEDEKVYLTFKKLEDALTNNPRLLYLMKQSFFPILPPRNWLGSGVIVVPIHTCVVTTINADSCQETANKSLPFVNISEYHQCWDLYWSNSPLLNLVPVDILLAFEPLFVDATYSGFIGGLYYRYVDIPLNITLPCMPSNSSTERALALLLRWVSFFVVSFMHVTM